MTIDTNQNFPEVTWASDEIVNDISQRLIEQNLEAYKELAKSDI
jgi:hypothetical protein